MKLDIHPIAQERLDEAISLTEYMFRKDYTLEEMVAQLDKEKVEFAAAVGPFHKGEAIHLHVRGDHGELVTTVRIAKVYSLLIEQV